MSELRGNDCLRSVLCLWWVLLCLDAQAALNPPAISPPGGFVHSPALVTITNPNPGGAIFYTLDGSDPRGHFGDVVTNARCYLEPLSVNRSLIIRARVKSGTNWSELVAAPFTADQDFSKLVFTEIMYNPHTFLGNQSEFEEFVELKNVGDVPLNLSGLRLHLWVTQQMPEDGVFVCPPGTVIGAGEFFILARSTNVFRTNYPNVRVHGQTSLSFGNAEGMPGLAATNGAVAAMMAYNTHAPWPVVPDNHGYFGDGRDVGFSLVRSVLDPASDPTHFSTWRASTYRFGSPGADDPAPTVPPVYVNELLTRPGPGLLDSVELFNPNPTDVHLGGWWLSDRRNWPYRYMVPLGTYIPPFGFLVLDESHFNTGTNNLSFNSDWERCYLFSGDTNGNLTGYSHGFGFKGSERNVSFGRNRSSYGGDYFLPEIARTFGSTNTGPRLAPLQINEFMYRPDGTNVAFIELRNITDAPLPLWDSDRSSNVWALGFSQVQMEDGYTITFRFPADTVIPASGYALLVKGNPVTFQTAHNVPTNVPVFQLPADFPIAPFVLYRPAGTTDANDARYVVVDEVRYLDRSPWDPGAAGGGTSLERIGLTPYGNDPVSWRASPTGSSPGRDNSGNLPPQVWAGGPRVAFAGYDATILGFVSDDHWPGTAVTSWWTQISGPAAVQFQSNTLASTAVSFSQTGQYVLRLAVSDGVSTNIDDATVTVITRPFDSWRTTNFTSGELINESISGPSADPDGDGLNNAEEYFFATAPKVFNTQPPFRAELINGHPALVWTQRVNPVDVTIAAQRTDWIEGPWFGGPGLFEYTETLTPQPDSIQVRLRSLVPATASGQQFIRLQLGLAE